MFRRSTANEILSLFCMFVKMSESSSSRLLEESRCKGLELGAQLLQCRQQCTKQEEGMERMMASYASRLGRLRALVQVGSDLSFQ